MIFTETALPGAFVIDLERREDSRGFFARAFCQHEFADQGLKPVIAQANVAFNVSAGTLRGMHFQYPPKAETKIVRCTRGAILDIIVDLRPESPTYLAALSVELNEDNRRALYVPERFAHGYQTLVDGTETSYQVGEFYAPGDRGRARVTTTRGSGLAMAVARRGDLGEGPRQWEPLELSVEPEVAPTHGRCDRGGGAMILVDTALRAREAEGRPIRVGMVGAGFMGQGLANQIVNTVPGMRAGRSLEPRARARRATSSATPASRRRSRSTTQAQLEDGGRGRAGRRSPTTAFLLCRSRARRRRRRGHRRRSSSARTSSSRRSLTARTSS